jgi:hypothetical protein
MAVLDHMIRNDDFIRRYAPTPENLNVIRDSVGYFLEHCIRLVIRAGRAGEENTGPEVRAVITAIGLPYLTKIAFDDRDKFWVRLKRKQAKRDIETAKDQLQRNEPRTIYSLSGREVPYYWIDDAMSMPNEQQPLYDLFAELSDPPPRPSPKGR